MGRLLAISDIHGCYHECLVRELVKQGAIAHKGNHDQMFVDYFRDNLDPYLYSWNGGDETIASYNKVPREELLEHLAFLEKLPLTYETEEYLFVHTGIDPSKPLAEQEEEDLLWIREPWLYCREHQLGEVVFFGHSVTLHWYGQRNISRLY